MYIVNFECMYEKIYKVVFYFIFCPFVNTKTILDRKHNIYLFIYFTCIEQQL